ncbi:YheC/YheD family protein [Neobacillus niacini]|uniref:YheC/YheD family endospore coat-associated protein n=1 Tax=Neobacillus niacini TaxID=86668 RepID=UPI003983015F
MVFIRYQENQDTILIPMKLLEQYKIGSQRIILKIGGYSKELAVKVHDELPDNTIGVPQMSNELTIPEDIPYELVMNGRVLSLGPVIALVAYLNPSELTPKRLESLKGRFSEYLSIKGIIYVCASRGINIEKKHIEGYYYHPQGDTAATRWIYGAFPYPDVVYKRHPIDTVRYNDLISQIGDRVINSYYFCKGELPEYASRNEVIKELFPETEKLTGLEQLSQMLRKHPTVYLKPPKGEGGRGIFNVTMDAEGNYVFVNHNNLKTMMSEPADLNQFLEKFIHRQYIIQQGVSTTIGDKNVDFRVYMQKNGLKQWECQGMIGRVAKKDKIVTNLKYTDKLLMGIEAIKLLFGVGHYEAMQIQSKVYDNCMKVGMELDKCVGNYGDVAIDCIVDRNYHVWILEINKRYGYDSLAKVKNYHLRKRLFVTPFRYAKALAGF